MKKMLTTIGIVSILFLMVSCATAVPTTHSKPLMDKIEQIEQTEMLLESNGLSKVITADGIIDTIIQLLTVIIQLVLEIIAIVQGILGIINLIKSLINALTVLFDLVNQLIELIMGLFNPDTPAIATQ